MKDDEWELLVAIANKKYGEWPTNAVAELGMNDKRAEYILEKWSRKEWLEYGVSPFWGWLLEKGLEAAKSRPH